MSRKVIMFTGGGTAGHITPVLAVAKKIHLLRQADILVYVLERNNRNEHLILDSGLPFRVHHIFAGKYRRFHNQKFLARVLSFKNNLLNTRDVFYVAVGLIQSLGLLLRYQPVVLFSKGGYVSLPVMLGAALFGIPFVTHDSDSVPGLANRLVGRWAKKNAVGFSKARYPYKPSKTIFLGVPVSDEYSKRVSVSSKIAKVDIGLPGDSQVVFIGGSTQGARQIDDAIEKIAPMLLTKYPKLIVIHSFGRLNEDSITTRYKNLDDNLRKRLILKTFLPDIYKYAAAADIIITRAGATALADFGTLGKACIVVPAPHLTGGHQLANSKSLEEQSAIIVINDNGVGEKLQEQVEYLLQHNEERRILGEKLKMATPPDAAERLADIIIKVADRRV